MILLFNHIPVSLERKINEAVDTVKSTLGSDYYNVQGDEWFGDKLTIESLFPIWIQKEAASDSSVTITEIVKSYFRWLFSEKYGYGGKVDWENIHCPFTINDVFLEALASVYFPNEDFSIDSDLRPLLSNIKKFAIQYDENFGMIKGTEKSIKYALTTLLDLPINSCFVQSGSPGFIIVTANVPQVYKSFLNRCVYPAGTTIIYQSP